MLSAEVRAKLEEQVAAERKQLLEAPRVEIQTGTVIRCSFCGQPVQHARFETHKLADGHIEQVRGTCCGA